MADLGKKGYMVEELRKERERSKLNLEELTNLLDGGEMFTEKRRRMSKGCINSNLHYTMSIFYSETSNRGSSIFSKRSLLLVNRRSI